MILILIIGGVLMLMLGIIGEYTWRIYDEVKGKPNYVVRDVWKSLRGSSSISLSRRHCCSQPAFGQLGSGMHGCARGAARVLPNLLRAVGDGGVR